RVILIIPNNVIFKPGFEDSISIIKDIASQLNTTIKGLVIRDDLIEYENISGRIRPNVKIDFKSVESWETLYENNLNDVKTTDLVILLSARRGTVAWHPEMESLPNQLVSMNLENFI